MSEHNELTINWYRTKLDKQTLKELNERSDVKGFIQAGGYLAIVAATAALSIYAALNWSWPYILLALFIHGNVYAFMINGIHELVHGTVFRTKSLNTVFVHILSFLSWHNHYHFWGSHAEHHKYTLHPPDDMEEILPKVITFRTFLSTSFINFGFVRFVVTNYLRWSCGKLKGEWETHIFENNPGRKRMFAWARVVLLGHLVLTAVSLYFGYWIIPVVITLGSAYGGLLFFFCNNAQHVGLQDYIPDFRLNSRTILLNPFVRFLYWQMNYHIEHHMYAGVPCYNLEKLHWAIKSDLPRVNNGLVATWFEIIGILWRQSRDPEYQYIPSLPGKSQVERVKPSEKAQTYLNQKQQSASSLGSTAQENARIWECTVCGFIYNEALGLPEEGIAPGTAWEDIPEDWACPDCGVAKSDFTMVEITPGASAAATPQAEIPAVVEVNPEPVVIVGSGLAAYSLVKEFRKLNPTQRVLVITEGKGEVYSKPKLSNAFAEKAELEELATATSDSFAQKHSVEIWTDTKVEKMDTEQQFVETTQGRVAYSKLVLTIGAEPIRLPIEGDAQERIFSVNSLADYKRFRAALPDSGRVVIIGAGLIGCEFADDMVQSGYSVSVVDIAEQALGRLVPADIADSLKEQLAAQGVQFHLSNSVQSIALQDDESCLCRLADGSELVADVVLSAVGLRAHTQLAAASGLEVGRGILVDATLQTSAPQVYALGDCAEYSSGLKPYILPIMHAARALASTLSGQSTQLVFPVMPVVVKTPSCPIVIASPDPSIEGAWECEGTSPHLAAYFKTPQGELVGFVLCGKAVESSQRLARQITEGNQSILDSV